ncbi:TetR/AcrR family transcriptional regulator [Goodfellowiella coeruleoviolacea]|uniref:Transcriptional regulator, TetR family n=1 Tax=Goodfellowiella coeruleoviolacea TaxID=334858 RepID=A0AAE3GKI1_9PSEU|nr:TetR family transcriptional regulator [Goodfellowiella coeruleoviolacea]MCP2169155.1 transcriptional regulator, TetR family [Goodfellowiella coeruleoviolacea]
MPFTNRSLAAREAILSAARARFTEQGYDRTTIRQVATDANTDPSMVMRYYGSKDKLFAAAVAVDLRLPDLTDVPDDEVAGLLANHFVTMWRDDDDGPLTILLRSAVTHEDAAERLRAVFANQVTVMVRQLLGHGAETDLRAGLLSTHLLGVALSRHILRLPPVARLSDKDLVAITTQIVDHILTGPLPVKRAAKTGGRERRTRRS